MIRSRWSRSIIAGAAVAITLPLAACGGGSGGGAGSTDDPQIRLSWWGSDARARNQQEFIDLCMSENPGLDVLGETASWGDFTMRLATQSAADDLPDVFTVIDPFMYEYLENGDFLDLRTVADHLDLSDFPADTFADVMGENGEIFGVSLGHSGHGIVINPEVFDELGVPIPDDTTWTWQDFKDTAIAISEASGGEVAGTTMNMDGNALQVWLRQQGYTLSQVGDQPFDATPEAVASYFQFMQGLIDAGATIPPAQMVEDWSGQAGPEQANIVQGRVAMEWTFAMNQLGMFEEAAQHELRPMLWPGESEGERGAWLKEGTWLVINSNTRHPEQAATLVNCLVNNIEGARIMGLDRGIPASTAVAQALNEDLSGADARFAEWVRQMNASVERPWERWNTGVGTVFIDEFSRANELAMFHQGTPESIAEAFLAALRTNAS